MNTSSSLMTEDYATKWGSSDVKEENKNIFVVITAQVCILILSIIILTPKWVLKTRTDMQTDKISKLKTLITVALIVGFTFSYPILSSLFLK